MVDDDSVISLTINYTNLLTIKHLTCGADTQPPIHTGREATHAYMYRVGRVKTPIYTGTETDTHAHCIPGRVAGRNDLSYIVNSGKTHCK